MQDRPDMPALLDAISRFLLAEVHPALDANKKLQFRVLIAANLANIVSSELQSEDAQDAAQLQRLEALFPDSTFDAPHTTETRAGRHARIAHYNARLADAIRSRTLTPDALQRANEHVRKALVEKLAVNNPRFDLSRDID